MNIRAHVGFIPKQTGFMKGKLREFNVGGMKLLPYKAATVHWDFRVEDTVFQAKELFCLFYKS